MHREEEVGRARVVAVEWSGGRIAALVLTAHPLRSEGRPLTLMRYEYDGRGDLVASTDRYGHRRTYRYDDGHRLVFRTDRNGYGFEYAYDGAGRCVFAQGVDGVEAVRLRYMPEAQATEVTLADGGAWLHRYDEVGSITEIIDPYGGVERFEYDAEGRLVAETDAGANRRTALHDAISLAKEQRRPMPRLRGHRGTSPSGRLAPWSPLPVPRGSDRG